MSLCIYCTFMHAVTVLYTGVCDIYLCLFLCLLLQWAHIFKMDSMAKLYNDFWENNKLRFQIKAIMEMRLGSN